jgi:hypothetical protein
MDQLLSENWLLVPWLYLTFIKNGVLAGEVAHQPSSLS